DRPFALLNRALRVSHEAVRPPEERVPLRRGEEGEGAEVEVFSIVEFPQALQNVRGVEGATRGDLAGAQVAPLRVQWASLKGVVDALREVPVVVSHDPSLPGVLYEGVPDEETGPCRFPTGPTRPLLHRHVRDREFEELPSALDPLFEREPLR